MAYTAIPHFIWPPFRGKNADDIRFINSTDLDAAGHNFAVLFRCPKDCTINEIRARFHSHTTTGDCDFRIETVDETTDPATPSGTLATTNSNKVVSITGAGWFSGTLTASHTASQGDLLAVVLNVPGGSALSANVSKSDQQAYGYGFQSGVNFPFMTQDVGSGYSDLGTQGGANVMVGCSDGTWLWIPVCSAQESHSDQNFSSSSNPNECGIRYQFPVDHRVLGLVTQADVDLADAVGRLRDDSGTSLADTGVLTQESHSAVTIDNITVWLFTSSYEASADTWYRATLDPNEANNLTLRYIEVHELAAFEAWHGLGSPNLYWTEYTGAAWVDTNTTRLPVGFSIIIDALQAGGGGGVAPQPKIIQNIGTY